MVAMHLEALIRRVAWIEGSNRNTLIARREYDALVWVLKDLAERHPDAYRHAVKQVRSKLR